MAAKPKSVVLLGDVGMGKSTIVEKVAGLIDTPGSNAMSDKLEHNVWIAHALNLDPVCLILLVVKADTRIDNAVKRVREYAERFGDLIDIMSVCITHMDTVTWSEAEFKNCLLQELGIESVIFVGQTTVGSKIRDDILKECRTPMDLTITSENFLKYFKINNSSIKILQSVRAEVADFQSMNRDFQQQLNDGSYSAQDKIDLVFEFQSFMNEEIYAAQQRVAEKNGFTFIGDATANEAGHIADMTNQLRATLLEVRTTVLGYQSSSGISDLRKCPHCGQVWAKLEGCDGQTICGEKPTSFDGRFNILANFSFKYEDKRLKISKTGTRRGPAVVSRGNAGCGKTIAWRDMAPVQVPREFHVQTVVTTDDVEIVSEAAKPSWENLYGKVVTKIGALGRTLVGY